MIYPAPTPRKHKDSFLEVLHNTDNQVLVRDLVEELMPDSIKQLIIERFNEDVTRYNRVLAEQIQSGGGE